MLESHSKEGLENMFDPEEESRPVNENPQGEQTDRVNGEYHYRNGYTQRIYSDAHYVRADESTVPPRYYTPPEKPPREAREEKPKKGVGLRALIAACLICAILGGLGGGVLGGAVMSGMMNQRFSAIEESVSSLSEDFTRLTVLPQSPAASAAPAATAAYGGELSGADIYDLACKQVVGVTTSVTYTNFFGMTSSAAVSGSGFIITEDGYILTNYHVIEEAYKNGLAVTVMVYDGTRYDARIIGGDRDNDIALLKIEADGFTPATIGNSETLRVGDAVYAVGNPLGELQFSMNSGHVSAKDRRIVTDRNSEAIAMFQFDAAINSGNSGGPVYNARGEVVGVATAKPASTSVEGISFAIPINDAAAIARDLITRGYVTGKAWLGVTINSNYNEMYAQYYGWPMGAYVDTVVEGSSADRAGIEPGDIITKLGDDEITGYASLRAAIRRHSVGDTAELEIYRADESRTVTVTLDEERPEQ